MEQCDICHEHKQNVLLVVTFSQWASRIKAALKISGKYLLCLHRVEMMWWENRVDRLCRRVHPRDLTAR